MKDGLPIEILETEVALAKKFANFEISNKLSEQETEAVLFQAYLLYACIAKKIQLTGYYGCELPDSSYFKYKPKKEYRKALRLISKISICTDKCYVLLGLNIKGSINSFTADSTLNKDGT